MNSTITVLGTSTTPLPYWQRPVIGSFAEIENIASRFIASSELSRINRMLPGNKIYLSALLFALLRDAWTMAQLTGYLFHPLIGTAINKLGYNQSFERLPRSLPGPAQPAIELERIRDVLHSDALVFNEQDCSLVKNTELALDLGGIGKGWAADRAADIMKSLFGVPAGIVDAGGDMSIWSDDQPWTIGIQDPYKETEYIVRLSVGNAGVATSHTGYRSWSIGGIQYHHILHGHTGTSASSDIIQATAVAPTAAKAEVAAKVLCMLGTELAGPWFDQHCPDVGFILVRQGGEVIINRKLFQYAVIMEE